MGTTDPLILSAAGSAVVKVLASDGWQQAKAALVRLWRGEDTRQQAQVGVEIAETRELALVAVESDDESAQLRLTAQWHHRFWVLTASSPEKADELKTVLEQVLGPLLSSPDQDRITAVQQTIHAGRDAYVAGGSLNIFRGQTINDR